MTEPKIKYDIEANVLGQGEVNALARQVEGLAGTLDGQLKTSALASATALRSLGEKQGAIESFTQIKRESQDASDRLNELQASAQQAGQKLALMGPPTRAQVGALEKLRTEVRSAKDEVQNKTLALDRSRASLQAYGISTNNIAEADRNVRVSIAATRQELQGLAPAFAAAGQSAQASAKSTAEFSNALGQTKEKTAGIGATFKGLAPLIAGAFTGRELVASITSADSLKRGLEAVAGSTKAAESEMAFIKKTSNELGLETVSAGNAYLQLMAATKGTALEGGKTREVFISVSRAMSALGKSTAETDRALRAVSQIASKGTVSMEELRGQLGEALPGALKAAADGMGVTTQELIRMVESGGVLAQDLLPALSQNLDKIYAGKAQDGLVQQFNRFKNAVTDVSVELGERGLTKALGDVAVLGAKGVGALGNGFVSVGQGIGELAGAISTLNFKPLFEESAAGAERARQAFVGVNNEVDAMASAIVSLNYEPLTEGIKGFTASSTAGAEAARQAFRQMEIAAQNADNGLSRAAKNSVAEFDKLREKGDSAAEAVAKIGKDFDLSNSTGIKDAAAALAKLSNDGKINAKDLKDTWERSLKGIDLSEFSEKSRKAFEGSKENAALAAQAIEAGLREAFRRAGVDVQELRTGISDVARQGINDFTLLTDSIIQLGIKGQSTDRALTSGLNKSLETATTKEAVQALIERLKYLEQAGLITGQVMADAMTKAKAKIDELTPGINSAAEAFKFFGMRTQEELARMGKDSQQAYEQLRTSGQATADQLSQAFIRAANDAIAANKGLAPGWVQAEAAIRGATVAVDEKGKAVVKLADKTSQATADMARGFDNVRGSVRMSTEELQRHIKALDEINARYGQSQRDSAGKYTRPGEGPDNSVFSDEARAKRLAGQNAVDNSLRYKLEDKLRAGTIGKDDVADLKNVIAALAQNDQLYRSNPSAYSTEGIASAERDRVLMKLFSDMLASITAGSGQGIKRTEDEKKEVGKTTTNSETKSSGYFDNKQDSLAFREAFSELRKRGLDTGQANLGANDLTIRTGQNRENVAIDYANDTVHSRYGTQSGDSNDKVYDLIASALLAKKNSEPASQSVRKVVIELNVGGSKQSVSTDDAGAEALIKTLTDAKLRSAY